MIKLKQNESPKFFNDKWKIWTKQYIETGNWNTNWHGYQEKILDELKEMSNSHCAFCDDTIFPITGEKGQIEHFRPKKKYKCFSFAWGNLYPICTRCNQSKGNQFNHVLLKPDEKNFEFNFWFWLKPNFELEPNKIGNPNWIRAEKTIQLYGLNKADKIKRRKRVYNELRKGEHLIKTDQPFRFIKSNTTI